MKKIWHMAYAALIFPFEEVCNLIENLMALAKKLKCEKICFFISVAVSVCGVALVTFVSLKDASVMTKIIATTVGGMIGFVASISRANATTRFVFSWLVAIACLPLRLAGITFSPLTWKQAKAKC